ncbi:hypothetical protein [Flagellimonas sp.]|uniref:hypothetical protein n=1 Tax=Flagellimonas sp. TaxID=2058762 RepID=UPI003F4A50E0
MSKEEAIKNWIEDTYGSPKKLAQVLDVGIEMLFYLEENTFEKREVQDVVSALRGMITILRAS